MLLGAATGAGVLGWLAARFVRADGPPGWPLGAASREAFWKESMPWPRGVQEDAEITWHVPRREPDHLPAGPPSATGRPVPPTRPQPRMTGR